MGKELGSRDFTSFAHKVSPAGYIRADLRNAAAQGTYEAVESVPSALGFLLRSPMSHGETTLNMCLLVNATLIAPKKFPLTSLFGVNCIAFSLTLINLSSA